MKKKPQITDNYYRVPPYSLDYYADRLQYLLDKEQQLVRSLIVNKRNKKIAEGAKELLSKTREEKERLTTEFEELLSDEENNRSAVINKTELDPQELNYVLGTCYQITVCLKNDGELYYAAAGNYKTGSMIDDEGELTKLDTLPETEQRLVMQYLLESKNTPDFFKQKYKEDHSE